MVLTYLIIICSKKKLHLFIINSFFLVKWQKVLQCFTIQSNFNELFKFTDSSLSYLDGFRAYNICILISGHRLLFTTQLAVLNKISFMEVNSFCLHLAALICTKNLINLRSNFGYFFFYIWIHFKIFVNFIFLFYIMFVWSL